MGYGGGERGRLYTCRCTVTTAMSSCVKMGSDESHFNVSLIVKDKVTRLRQCLLTTTFEEKVEPKRIRTKVPLLTSLTPPNRLTKEKNQDSVCIHPFSVSLSLSHPVGSHSVCLSLTQSVFTHSVSLSPSRYSLILCLSFSQSVFIHSLSLFQPVGIHPFSVPPSTSRYSPILCLSLNQSVFTHSLSLFQPVGIHPFSVSLSTSRYSPILCLSLNQSVFTHSLSLF